MPQDIVKQDVNIGEVVYQWTVAEYTKHNRNKRWYLIAGVVGLAMVVYAVLSSNALFALIIVLIGIILFMQDMVEPMDVPMAITNTGIVVGSKYYRWSELKNFWVIYDPPQIKNLYFGLDNLLRHRIQIPLGDNDPAAIRDYLNQYLEEDLDQEEEPLSDRLGRVWKL